MREASARSFNGTLGDEVLKREIFYSLEEAQVLIEQWRREYNTIRPHSSLAYQPPAPEAIRPEPAFLNLPRLRGPLPRLQEVLHQDRDIPLDDGLVDKVDLAADPVVEFGGVGISRPVGEHRLRPAPLVRCPDDDHDFDPAAAIPKRLPEFAVRSTPGAESRRCLVARIDVDEDGALGVKRDREPEREVAPEVPGRSPVDPPGQEPVLDAERLEGGHLLRLGREPRPRQTLRRQWLVPLRERGAGFSGSRSGAAIASSDWAAWR